MSALLKSYNTKKNISLEDIIDFHHRFESIHPFQDGNGRVGRLIMFKECLRYGIVPFIITDELKMFYYRGLSEWNHIRGYLLDTCLTAQDEFKEKLDKAKINEIFIVRKANVPVKFILERNNFFYSITVNTRGFNKGVAYSF